MTLETYKSYGFTEDDITLLSVLNNWGVLL